MSNVVTTSKPRSSAMLWFGLLLNLLLAVYVLSSLHMLLRYKREYKVDERIFSANVQLAVSNYLSSVVSPSSQSSASSYQTVVPKVVLVPNLGFFHSPVRGDFVLIDGGRYKVGDYCNHGLIVRILDDRAYCRDGEELLILRSSPVQVSNPAFAPSSLPPGGSSTGGKEEEQGGILGLRL